MRVPKKNVYKILSDIKPISYQRPIFNTSQNLLEEEIRVKVSKPTISLANIGYQPQISKLNSLSSKKSIFKKIKPFLVGALSIAVIIYGFSIFEFKSRLQDSLSFVSGQFVETASALKSFNTSSAQKSLSIADREISTIRQKADSLGLSAIMNVGSSLIPKIKEIRDSFNGLEIFTASSILISQDLEDVQKNGFSYFLNKQGENLIAKLKNLRQNIAIINKEGEKLIGQASAQDLIPQNSEYLSLKTSLLGMEDFLDGLITLLDTNQEKHWLVTFQNSSEIRATGGFIGSYADLTIQNGSLKNMEVVDIYDSDGQIDSTIIPPKPLQAISTNWKTRDANWFFDFKLSAEKIKGFLNSSKIYTERGVNFTGVTAINTNVFESLLDILGPIEMPDYDLTITKDNFLRELQREIEVIRTKDKGQPKTVLKDLTPLIISKIQNLEPSQREQLIAIVQHHFNNKDIMFYSEDKKLQSFFEKHNVAGRILNISSTSANDYLAVVNTNIAGGKTDAFINQSITLKSEIFLDGTIFNVATIERTHNGGDERDAWYNTKNQNHMRLYVPLGSKLINIDGATKKTIYEPIDYTKAGYDFDSDIVKYEEQKIEGDKSIFDTWLTTLPSQTKDIIFEYELPHKLFLRDGGIYQFVYEKQSGINSKLDITIEAPPGFKWKEINGFTYKLKIDQDPKRFIVPLTLEQI
ncbi:MAG: hypothetical protein COV57_02585 [Candidatus Liptonbacteria bacterium CG11_big_fil_rev_8_21_14_0_20_35_14]|uniref:DUF4012 domain-containing protein n=1 Tax=Candidatus Liptonbacteria bacterium CG11_big_fil_rev_8_21_14_0_20_35_14 TaxID=1974634 RepID=A0A2H0N9H4_9BACT|nr:MAG: hypothetical protein COV57_02585 [Candidatus Liptonbacteria bacterium CG11_big_fil_rev_8_21_14_0_20_35_14]